ncbi:MAG: Dps family protein [Rickettsiales bacterium]
MTNTVQTLKKTDSVEVTIGVNSKERKDVAKALSGYLASTYMLYLKTLYYHWNVTGTNFVGLHELFEQQYEELHTAGDELAERVRALGHFTPGTVKEFVALSNIDDDEKLPPASDEMVERLLRANEDCSKQARDVLKVAEEAEDEVTVDMMVARMTAHDKAAWMLRSILQ